MQQSKSEQPGLGPEDVTLVRRAAVLAGATVAISRYSGEGGTRDEFRGIIEGLEQAVAKYPNNPLVQALISDETRAEADGLYPQFRRDPTQKTYDDFQVSRAKPVRAGRGDAEGKSNPGAGGRGEGGDR